MAKLAQNFAKYLVTAKLNANGVVERPDVIGAIFGQTEGLLGAELDLRELQRTGRIGRIEVMVRTSQGKSSAEITIPSSLDAAETSLIAASLETIQRIGPSEALVPFHAQTLSVELFVHDREPLLSNACAWSLDSETLFEDMEPFTCRPTEHGGNYNYCEANLVLGEGDTTFYSLDSIYGSGPIKLSVQESGYFLRNVDPNSGDGFSNAQLYYSNQQQEFENNLRDFVFFEDGYYDLPEEFEVFNDDGKVEVDRGITLLGRLKAHLPKELEKTVSDYLNKWLEE